MEEIKKKRGRPRKTLLPEEILKLVEEVLRKEEQEIKDVIKEVKEQHKGEWDVRRDDPISFFDTRLSYELTGYKPIDETHGLDFDPNWFTEARDTFLRTGHYTLYRRGTKAYKEFWDLLYIYCREGKTVNGYTITGDHYFFLNYYLLMDLTSATKAGGGRTYNFPKFFTALYKWFHYLELCRCLRLNAALMKARGVGYSENDASVAANTYNCRRNSVTVIAALLDVYLLKTLDKVWKALSFINDYTDGGFFKLRQVNDSQNLKKASHYKIINGQKIETGWMSQIQGINADKPNKIRGDRTDLLIYEEGGSWPNSTKAFIQGDALTGIQGARFGIKIIGGTGGDSGAALLGLRDIYYHPEVYDVLPYRHNYTPNKDEVLTAFFIPAYEIVNLEGYIDSRGFTPPEKGIEYYNTLRAKKAKDPNALVIYTAEYCFTAEEGFSLEGDNKFNKANIAEQLTAIRALKQCPPIDTGIFRFNFKGNVKKVSRENIADVIWKKVEQGKIRILEHPLWTLQPLKDPETGIVKERIKITNHLYVAGIDGIDIGMSETSSLTRDPSDFCMVVKKRIYGLSDPAYVAIYKDRPDDIREAYETAIALAMYYNCVINIEATRRGMVTWARDRHFMNYFMKRPSATYNDISKRKSTEIGTPANSLTIDHLTDLIRDFINDYYYTIWFEDMLDEFNRYTDENKGKFDIVAAVAMAELADEELQGVVPKVSRQEEDVFEDIGYYYDENRYKRFGVIPKRQTFLTNFKNYTESNYGLFKTSDPRYNQGMLW